MLRLLAGLIIEPLVRNGMELFESVIWVSLGFGPTLAALAVISKAGIFRIRKDVRIARIAYPGSGKD